MIFLTLPRPDNEKKLTSIGIFKDLYCFDHKNDIESTHSRDYFFENKFPIIFELEHCIE